MSKRLVIEIVSDVVCPWCWIGKRNLEKALQISGRSLNDVDIIWKPYQLRPDTPEKGIEKAPDVPENPRVGRRLREAGSGVGIEFTGKCDRTPNTLKAHALLKLSAEQQKHLGDATLQNQVSEVLFRKYFTEGQFIGDSNVLVETAAEVGIDRQVALSYINNEETLQEVRLEAKRNAQKGITGVPTFSFNGQVAFSGAQPPEVFLRYLTP